jgi:hypothetical protein
MFEQTAKVRSLQQLAVSLAPLAVLMTGALTPSHAGHLREGGAEEPVQGCKASLLAAPLVRIENEPPPRLIADAPIPSQLAEGRVVIRYCVENLRILPVFGKEALGVSPRLGHLHITVNEGPFRWLDTSGQPVIVNKLPPGPHSILIELVDPTHRTLDRQVVKFVVPETSSPH